MPFETAGEMNTVLCRLRDVLFSIKEGRTLQICLNGSWRVGIELVFSQGIILKERTPGRDSSVVLHVKAKSWQGIFNF